MYTTINSFASAVVDSLKVALEENYPKYDGAEIKVVEVTKNNNEHLVGVSVKRKDSKIAPTIYLEKAYTNHLNDELWEDMIDELVDTVLKSDSKEFEISIDDLTNLDKIRDRIFPKLINTAKNTNLLTEVPHTDVEDLSVIYAINVESGADGRASVTIKNTILDSIGITKKELHNIAMDNLAKSNIDFRSMRDVMVEMMFPEGIDMSDPMTEMLLPPDDGSMYVLSNKEKSFGAASILDKATMDSIFDKLGGGFIIIPSSIHEVIILPYKEDSLSADELSDMIQSVNVSSVDNTEVLSDHPYIYNKSTGICTVG